MTTRPKNNPDDPTVWLKRAKSSLIQAKLRSEGIYLEDLCFNAHQAVEKSLKALLLKVSGKFPFTHHLVRLNTEIEKKIKPLPAELTAAEFLSAYSVASRYPGWDEDITEKEYLRAVAAAEAVINWVSTQIADANI